MDTVLIYEMSELKSLAYYPSQSYKNTQARSVIMAYSTVFKVLFEAIVSLVRQFGPLL